jgi:hypothetical protein
LEIGIAALLPHRDRMNSRIALGNQQETSFDNLVNR